MAHHPSGGYGGYAQPQPPHPYAAYQQPQPYGYAPHMQQQTAYGYAPPPPPPAAAAPPAAAPSAAPGVPYIGARISLVSNMNIRYEGTLYTIDTKASTVALQNVRCFGTESRGADGQGGGGFIPPSSDIYEFVVFSGKDIKDLAVLQPQEQQQPQPPQPQMQEPAAFGQQQAPQPPQQDAAQPAPPQPAPQQQQQPHQRGGDRPARGGRGGGGQQGSKHTVRVIDEPSRKAQSSWSGAASSSAASAPAPSSAPAAAPAPDASANAEFDFNAANARFEKIEAKHEEAVPSYELPSGDAGLDQAGFPVVKKAYNKSSSFFDSLSTDKSADRSVDRQNVRRVDVDTFGADASHYRSKHGRGRGGRRGGGGGGGGGRQNQQGGGGGQWRQGGQ